MYPFKSPRELKINYIYLLLKWHQIVNTITKSQQFNSHLDYDIFTQVELSFQGGWKLHEKQDNINLGLISSPGSNQLTHDQKQSKRITSGFLQTMLVDDRDQRLTAFLAFGKIRPATVKHRLITCLLHKCLCSWQDKIIPVLQFPILKWHEKLCRRRE